MSITLAEQNDKQTPHMITQERTCQLNLLKPCMSALLAFLLVEPVMPLFVFYASVSVRCPAYLFFPSH
jgi:hypothetical protein